MPTKNYYDLKFLFSTKVQNTTTHEWMICLIFEEHIVSQAFGCYDSVNKYDNIRKQINLQMCGRNTHYRVGLYFDIA